MSSDLFSKLNFNFNNLSLDDFSIEKNQETYTRILDISMPFIGMHETYGILANTAMSAGQIGHRTYCCISNIQNSDWAQAKNDTIQLCIITSKVALSVIYPSAKAVLGSCYNVFEQQKELLSNLSKRDYQKASYNLFQIVNELFSLSAVLDGRLALVAFSMTFKTLNELCNSYAAYYDTRGRKPEAVANLILALIKGYQTSTHLNSIYLNTYGKKLTQEDWEEFFWNELSYQEDEKPIDLDQFLKSKGYSSHIENLSFESKYFEKMAFKHMRFSNCNFSGAQFKKSLLDHVTILNSDLKDSLWIDSKVKNSFFEICNFSNFAFINCKSDFTNFKLCDIHLSCWNNSSLNFTKFESSDLSESHFLNSRANWCTLSKMTNLTDCFLFDAEEGFFIHGKKPIKTRPIVAMEWDFMYHGMMTPVIYEALNESGAFALRFEIEDPSIDVDLLENEVKDALSQMKNIDHSVTSIPQEILKRAKADSQIRKIIEITQSIIRHSDGLAIPGGADVEPEFYGKERDPATHTYSNHLRSMMEFALINAATESKVPVMGTCRGSQILNIFFGGTLFQDLEGHHGNSLIHIVPGNPFFNWAYENLGLFIPGLSLHHQGCDEMGKNLEVIYEYDGIPKIFSSMDELILGSQIHPEIFVQYAKFLEGIDENDADALSKIYIEMAKVYRDKNKGIYDLFMKRIADFSYVRNENNKVAAVS